MGDAEPGLGQKPQQFFLLLFPHPRQLPGQVPPIEQQAHPVALSQETVDQGGGGPHRVFQQALVSVGRGAYVQDHHHLGGPLFLVEVHRQAVPAGQGLPVDPARLVSGQILPHPEELGAHPASVGPGGTGGHQRAGGLDGKATQPLPARQYHQLPRTSQFPLPSGEPKWGLESQPDPGELVYPAAGTDSIV